MKHLRSLTALMALLSILGAGALAASAAGDAGWLIPLEPLLGVHQSPDAWAPVLARLRTRAA